MTVRFLLRNQSFWLLVSNLCAELYKGSRCITGSMIARFTFDKELAAPSKALLLPYDSSASISLLCLNFFFRLWNRSSSFPLLASALHVCQIVYNIPSKWMVNRSVPIFIIPDYKTISSELNLQLPCCANCRLLQVENQSTSNCKMKHSMKEKSHTSFFKKTFLFRRWASLSFYLWSPYFLL